MTESGNTIETPFILTNHPGRDKSPTWAKLSFQIKSERRFHWAVLDDFYQALLLFRQRKNFKVVVLGGGARVDFFYLVLQRLLPVVKRPVVKIDCLWYESKSIRQFFKKKLFKFVDASVDLYIVWAQREIGAYSRVFGLRQDKFRFVEYHTTVDLDLCKVIDGGFLFSGGNFARDYETLAKAVEGLDVQVIIACTNENALAGISFPKNVRVVAATHEEFMQFMAESHINVISLQKGLLHSGGQQTFLNAMALGKPVIVTDPEGAREYIEDGIHGILVPPEDPDRLREAIRRLKDEPELAARIAIKGKTKALSLNTEAHLAAIANLAKRLTEDSPT